MTNNTESETSIGASVTQASALAREQFMALVADIRPELHRYCARMTGSVFDGEDVLQDTLAKAWFALAEMDAPPPFRPWLFRIAHNAATDFLRRYDQRFVDTGYEFDALSDTAAEHESESTTDHERTDIALSILLTLPPVQRSAFAFRYVLEFSLEETAAAMNTTVGAVKAALVRARANVSRSRSALPLQPDVQASLHTDATDMAQLRRYAELFNARDWDALRTFFDEETHLDLVSYRQLHGAPAAQYFTRYEYAAPRESLRLVAGVVDGVPALAVFRSATHDQPAYFIQLAWRGDRIERVRDYRHVPYIARDVLFSPSR
ncbi:MAG: RNA polymerase sigma factor [Gemmatimonas sp.]